MHERIELIVADITTLSVDAVVNAANERMLGGGGVDGAIHRAAGSGLLDECRTVDEVQPGVRCPTGEARITGGHDLPASHVIHTAGPIWRGGEGGEPGLLASCYRSCLSLAAENGLESVAFPCISTGVYGYPKDLAAGVAVESIVTWFGSNPKPERVIICCFDESDMAYYQTLLN